MANHKSSEKRSRQTIVKTAQNKTATSKVRTAVKALKVTIGENKKVEAAAQLAKVQSLLNKLAKSSAMKKTTAARKTSRLALSINKLA